MVTAIIGLLLGLVIGAGCRFFDIPSPAPPRLIGACLLLAMTIGFVTAEHVLPPGTVAKDEVSIADFLVNQVVQFEP
jgi:XapX domain-containing protein